MYLFYLLIFLIPFPEYEKFSSVFAGLSLIKIVGIATVIAALFKQAGNKEPFWPEGKAKFWFVTFFVLFFFLHFSSENLYLWGMHVALFYVCMVFIDSIQTVKRIFWVTSAGILANCGLTIKSILAFGDRWSLRAEGTFGDPNYFAIALLMGVAFAYALYQLYPDKKTVVVSAIALLVFTLFKTGSRGGFIGFAIMSLIYLSTTKHKIRTLSLLMLIGVPSIQIFAPNVLYRLSSVNDNDMHSNSSRLELQIAGINMIKDNPISGVGYANFKPYSQIYNESVSNKQIAHNTYLQVAAELGLPIFIAFIGLILTTFRDLRSIFANKDLDDEIRVIARSVMIGLTGYTVSIMFLSAEREKYLWLAVILTMSLTKLAKHNSKLELVDFYNS